MLGNFCLFYSGSHVFSSLLFNIEKKEINFGNIACSGLCTKINYCLRVQKTRWYYVVNLLSYENLQGIELWKTMVILRENGARLVDFKHFPMRLVLDAISRLGGGRGCVPLSALSSLGECYFLRLYSEHGHFSRLLSWKWQWKVAIIIGFKVLGGESCHLINSSPYTLFLCCVII